MSDRDSLLFAAAAIGLAVCSVVWSLVGVGALTKQSERIARSRPAIEQSAEAGADQQSRYHRWSRATARGVLEDERTPTGEACESNPDCREQENLRAQQSVALATDAVLFWTRFQTAIAVAGTVLIWWGLLLNRDATRAATDANVLTRQQFAAERRAWLDFSVKAVGWQRMDRKENEVLIRIKISAKNIGASPATGVWFVVPGEARRSFLKEDVAPFKAEIEAYKTQAFESHGFVIFPDGEHEQERAALFRHADDERDQGTAFIPCYVRYDTIGSGGVESHATPFVLQLGYEFFLPTNEYRIRYSESWSLCPPPD